jgi:hypothetical protein
MKPKQTKKMAYRHYISKTKMTTQRKNNLYTIVQVIVLWYGPSWFHIKTKPELCHSTEHVLTGVKAMALLTNPHKP